MAAEPVCIDAIKLPPLDSDPHAVRPVASRYTVYATRSTVTDIKLFIIIIMIGLDLFYCLSNSYTIFDIIPYFRSLNIKLEFQYYLPFRLFISIFQQCLTIPHSLPFSLYPIKLKQSPVNKIAHSVPFLTPTQSSKQ